MTTSLPRLIKISANSGASGPPDLAIYSRAVDHSVDFIGGGYASGEEPLSVFLPANYEEPPAESGL